MLVLLELAAVRGADAAECGDAATQSELNVCADQNFRNADTRLNDAYRQAVMGLHGQSDRLALLTKAERAWVSFRDAECAFAGSGSEGGTIEPMIVSECLAQVTAEREKSLRRSLGRPQ